MDANKSVEVENQQPQEENDEQEKSAVEKPEQETTNDASPPTKRRKADEEVAGKHDNAADDDETEQSDNEKSALRRFRRIPVFIVDYHNDVLEFIYRCLGTRFLPLTGNTLVHFDSHPDMVISRELPASASYDKETMLTELSIENWIMPSCYTGHFGRVIWLKNDWCRQLPLGKYDLKIGQRASDKRIAVDLPLDYFIAEGSYCKAEQLEEVRAMELQVHNLEGEGDDDDDVKPDPQQFVSAADEGRLILDIDLDFFSTTNPFLEIYKEAQCYEQLTRIFHYDSSEGEGVDCSASTMQRREQLEALRSVFEYLEEKRSLVDLEKPEAIAEVTWTLIDELATSLRSHYTDDEIDWLLIYDSGSTTDSDGLPHHVSTEAELELYYARFKRFLRKLPVPPVAITMACSAEDDYCPKPQVEQIRERVLGVLNEVFGERVHSKPIRNYLDEDWDVWQL